MSRNYDNWEKLVVAVLLREELREIALCDSREPSTISDYESSICSGHSFGSSSPFADHQSLVHGEKTQLPDDYSDLMSNHTDWKALLPPGKTKIVWSSASLSFSLDKRTGKNCFMVGAVGLEIPKTHHKFVSYNESRFSVVAEVRYHLQPNYIRGGIEILRLSPNTFYGAFLVFKLADLSNETDEPQYDKFSRVVSREKSHDDDDAILSMYLFERMLKSSIATIEFCQDKFVDDDTDTKAIARVTKISKHMVVYRDDGWKEVDMGNFYVDGKQRGEVVVQLRIKSFVQRPPNNFLKPTHLKGQRPVVEGIEFRPTYQRPRSFGSFRWQTRKEKELNF